MTLRKITIDNKGKHIAQKLERDSKKNTIEENSLPRKQNKNLS